MAAIQVILDECDLAWAAGFLDGEGYFGLRSDRWVTPTVEAAQVATREPLDRLAAMFGGTVQPRRRGYRWTIAGAPQVKQLCFLLHSHLSVKREQAEVVLCCCLTFGRRGAPRLPFGAIETREACRERLLMLRAA